MKPNHLIIAAVVLMVVAFGWAAYLYNSNQSQSQERLLQEHAEALIQPHSPRLGNPEAKVTIVEFLDPACETCRQFYPLVKELMKEHNGKVNLVVRYAPFHPGSDQMVALLQAAQQQGRFWDVLGLMFETQSSWASHHEPKPEVFWNYLQGYGFDVERLQQGVAEPSVAAAVQQDMTDVMLLGVDKTPTFFVNGKPLPSFGYEQLRALVAAEVAANYP